MQRKLASLVAIAALLISVPVLAKVQAGDAAPDFSLKGVDGKEFKLSAFKDKKPVVFVIWQTACSSCQEEMVLVNNLPGRGEKFELVTINVDVRSAREGWKESLEKFFADKKLKLDVLIDPQYTVGKLYSIGATPSTVLINKDGKINQIITGFTPGADDADLGNAVKALK